MPILLFLIFISFSYANASQPVDHCYIKGSTFPRNVEGYVINKPSLQEAADHSCDRFAKVHNLTLASSCKVTPIKYNSGAHWHSISYCTLFRNPDGSIVNSDNLNEDGLDCRGGASCFCADKTQYFSKNFDCRCKEDYVYSEVKGKCVLV